MKRHSRLKMSGSGGAEHQFAALLRLDFIFLVIAISIVVVLSSIEAVIIIKSATETVSEVVPYVGYQINPTFGELLKLWIKTNFVYTTSLLLPFLLFSLAVQFGLSGVTRFVQRIVTIVMTIVYLFISNQIQQMSAEATFIYDLSAIPKIGFFRSIKFIEIAVIGLLVIIPFLSSASRFASKVRRLSFLVAVSFIYLVIDWRLSKDKIEIHPSFENGQNKPTFMVYFPNLSMNAMAGALNGSSMEDFRKLITRKQELIPVSNQFLPQLTSVLTGLLPYEHGIRSDHDSRFAFRYAKNMAQSRFFKPFQQTYVSNLGSTSDMPLLFFKESLGKKCIANLKNQIEVHITKQLQVAFSVLPKDLVESIFPIYRCSTHLENVSSLLSLEFDDLTEAMKSGQSIATLLWLEIGGIENKAALAEVFWREFEEFASSRKIQKYKLQLIGLTTSISQPGFVIEIDKDTPAASENLTSSERLSVVELYTEKLLPTAYFEQVDVQSKLKPETTARLFPDGEVDLMQTHFSYDRSDLLYALFRTQRFMADKTTLVATPLENAEFLKGNDINFALTHGMKSE